MLDCSYNELKELPNTIGELTELRELDCHENNLRVLPGEIGKLSKLTTLRLGINKLVMLPAETSQLWALHTLQLQSNQLASLPDCRDLLNVRELHLDDHVARELEHAQQLWTAAIQGMGAVLKVNPTRRTPAQVKMLKRGASRNQQKQTQLTA